MSYPENRGPQTYVPSEDLDTYLSNLQLAIDRGEYDKEIETVGSRLLFVNQQMKARLNEFRIAEKQRLVELKSLETYEWKI